MEFFVNYANYKVIIIKIIYVDWVSRVIATHTPLHHNFSLLKLNFFLQFA